jgi:hypothetical protein
MIIAIQQQDLSAHSFPVGLLASSVYSARSLVDARLHWEFDCLVAGIVGAPYRPMTGAL